MQFDKLLDCVPAADVQKGLAFHVSPAAALLHHCRRQWQSAGYWNFHLIHET